MIKRPRQMLAKLAMALVLIILSGCFSFLVKERIDSTDPDHSLPLIDVSVGYTKLVVPRANFEWSYITRTVYGPALSPESGDLQLTVLDVDPGAPVIITMSDPGYIRMKVSRADGLGSDYLELSGDTILTPTTPGVYIYKIEVGYKKGSLLYYTAVRVAENNIM